MAVSGNTLEAVIVARDQFSAKFESMMNRVTTSMQRGQKQSEFFSGSLVRMFAKFSIIEHGLRRLGAIIEQTLYPFKAVEEINMSLIRMSAMFTGMMEAPTGGKTIADQFNQAFKYSEDLFRTLVKINPYIAGGLKDLMLITEEMAKQGLHLDINNAKQIQAFQNIANAVITVSAGYQNREVQIRQESRSLMEGVIRPTNQLAMIVNSMVGGNLKVMTDQWKRQGVYLEKMGELLKGFEASAGRISLTWDAVRTTFESIMQLNMYENFQQLYLDLMKRGAEFNDWLMKNKDVVGNWIKAVWDAVANPVVAVVNALTEIVKVCDTIVSFFVPGGLRSIAKGVLWVFQSVIPTAITGAIEFIKKFRESLEDLVKKNEEKEDASIKAAMERRRKTLQGIMEGETGVLKPGSPLINKVVESWSDLGRKMGDGLWGEALREAEAYNLFVGEFSGGIKLGPRPPDPEAVKKYDEMMQSLEDMIEKRGDSIWGKFNVIREKAYRLAYDRQLEDFTELENRLSILAFQFLDKEKIHKAEVNIKILQADKELLWNQFQIVQERAKIMKLQGEHEIDIERFVTEKTEEIWRKQSNSVEKLKTQAYDAHIAQVKDEINHTNRLRDSKHDAYFKWYEDLKMVDDVLEEAYTKEGEIYDYLLTKTGKYYDYTVSRAMQAIDIEGEAFAAKYDGIIDLNTIMLYYYKKMEDKELALRELRLKHSQEFTEGWSVAYQKNLQDQYTWGQVGLEAYGEVSKAMSQTFSDFFYDAWTGKLKTAEQYFRSFTQSLLRAWADMVSKMLAQEAMLKLTSYFSGWGASGYVGGASAWQTGVGGSEVYGFGQMAGYHQGGYAPRLHKGLASDEFPAILQSGERVLSRSETTSLDSTRGGKQDIYLTINAVDARSFQQLLYENRGMLDSLTSMAINTNGQTRKAMRR